MHRAHEVRLPGGCPMMPSKGAEGQDCSEFLMVSIPAALRPSCLTYRFTVSSSCEQLLVTVSD